MCGDNILFVSDFDSLEVNPEQGFTQEEPQVLSQVSGSTREAAEYKQALDRALQDISVMRCIHCQTCTYILCVVQMHVFNYCLVF